MHVLCLQVTIAAGDLILRAIVVEQPYFSMQWEEEHSRSALIFWML